VPLLIVALIALVLVLPLILLPISIVQRYRVGTARRQARAWVATLNVAGFLLSACVLVMTSAVTEFWVPLALRGAAAGLAAGILLGVIGLWLSRWERGEGALYFTPNRWLVGVLTLLVLARLGYGAWRTWDAVASWGAGPGWLASAGVPGSLAAGALLIGYGLGFWSAVRWRITSQTLDA
jgi:hypothetical protein